MGLTILGPELLNLDHDLLVDTSSKLRSVSELEEDLKPHKHRGQENGLDKVVEQGRGTSLIFTVTNKLEDPANDVNGQGSLKGCVGVLQAEVVGESCAAHAEDGQKETCEWLQEQVQ